MHLYRTLLDNHDFDKPSIDIILDLIAISTGYRLEKKFVQFGTPQLCDPRPDIDYDANTFIPVVVDSRYDSRLSGENGFSYRRMSIDEIDPPQTILIHPDQYPFKVHEVITQINNQLHVQMTEDDLINDEFDQEGNGEIRINPNSLVWTGKFQVVLSSPGNPDRLFTVDELDGFEQSDEPDAYIGNSIVRLVDLINEENGTNYRLNIDFTIQTVQINTEDEEFNTIVNYNSLVPGKVSGRIKLNRLPISVLSTSESSGVVQITSLPTTTIELLPTINDALGITLTQAEVLNQTYQDKFTTYPLIVRQGSYAWLASTFYFDAVLPSYIRMENGKSLESESGIPIELESA